MSARTIHTLANGRGIDLLNPRAEDIDFDAFAEHLAKEKRFNGATPGVEYSVAEHLARGVDAILAAGESVRIAALYSIHDASEGVLKDDTTPKKRALAELIEQRCGILARVILDCIDDLTFIQNQAIYAASGLGWPHIDEAKRVHHYDLVMFVTEWRDLMRGIEHPDWEQYRNIEPLRDTIKPWPWEHAKGALLRRWHKVLPVFAQEAQ